MSRILAVASQKGGVGKTTTVVSVATNVALSGYRTLLIDLDPQGNATTGLGVNPRNLESSSYNVLVQQLPNGLTELCLLSRQIQLSSDRTHPAS